MGSAPAEPPRPGDWVAWRDGHGDHLGRVVRYRGRVHGLGRCLQVWTADGMHIVRVDDVTSVVMSPDDLRLILHHYDAHVRQMAIRALSDLGAPDA